MQRGDAMDDLSNLPLGELCRRFDAHREATKDLLPQSVRRQPSQEKLTDAEQAAAIQRYVQRSVQEHVGPLLMALADEAGTKCGTLEKEIRRLRAQITVLRRELATVRGLAENKVAPFKADRGHAA